MAPDDAVEEAVAVHADSIVAVGSSGDILQLAGASTRTIDLEGRTIIPGFVDAHSHLFDQASNRGMTFSQAQWVGLHFGVTAMADLYSTRELIDDLRSFDELGQLRMRTSVYMVRTDFCGEDLGAWYLDFPPTRTRDEMLRIGGIKIFSDGGVCGNPATSFKYRDGFGDLWMSQEKLNSISSQAHDAGYQLAIHAQGDRAIEQAQNAIEFVLDGGENTLRHRIEHNSFIRDDLLARYDKTGAVADISGLYPTCAEVKNGALSNRFGAENVLWMKDWRSLLDASPNLAAAWYSDYPYLVLDPIKHLY
ncbi:MAG: amidohydrolase family protein, partial [Pseudomonadales bacterium]